jgi:hypothetical protein
LLSSKCPKILDAELSHQLVVAQKSDIS